MQARSKRNEVTMERVRLAYESLARLCRLSRTMICTIYWNDFVVNSPHHPVLNRKREKEPGATSLMARVW
jgi:hypothetical protein